MIWIPVILTALLAALLCGSLIGDVIRWHRENRQTDREIQAIRKQQRIARRWRK